MKPTVRFTILRTIFISALAVMGFTHESVSQNVDFGKSYINVTKGVNGGTVETGDTLEIRASLVVRSGTLDSCRYRDVVPAGTTFINGTIRVLTNEGKVYKSFTDAYGDDAGWITASTITIHMGFNSAAAPATAFRRGRVANTHKPSFYSSTCIMIASFRVRVTAVTGTNISTGGGTMTYKRGSNPIDTYTFPNNILKVYPNYGICANTIGTNAIGTETNGTFGSGKPRNRGASANVPVGYTYSPFETNMPNDYYYGIANNTSTRTNYSTSNSWAKPDNSTPTHRVFSVWDIIGDHTGAVSPSAGNPAADTVANSNAGYMLVINAAYRIDSAFQQTISGLCPNTYYEISCWMRNICSKCGCDSNGKGATNSSGPVLYIPTGTGDSAGVRPNLTFEIDGIDYYTSGDLAYSGQWVKKGFTFLTGPVQTSFVLKFFNNAPGGGGNDWALDDISVSTCSPNMKYSPSLTPAVCVNYVLTLYDTVRSFFNNYVYYKWQRSTDGGTIWTDVTAPSGPAVPFWNGTAWEYVTSYTIPFGLTLPANSGDKYRLVVATTLANLSSAGCRFTDDMNIITLSIISCGIPLKAELLSFSGHKEGENRVLQWTTADQDENIVFEIERSNDGVNFSPIANVNSHGTFTSGQTQYSFTDNSSERGDLFYRLRMRTDGQQSAYSKVISFTSSGLDFKLLTVINPFGSEITLNISSGSAGRAEITLIDQSGKPVIKRITSLNPGINNYSLESPANLASGIYYLLIRSGENMIHRKLTKL